MKPYKRLNLEEKLDLADMLNRYTHYGWTKPRICRKWGISLKTFYGLDPIRSCSSKAGYIPLTTITPAEQDAIISYALAHTELNHRELAYRMIDADVACVSPSTAYRILRKNSLIALRSKVYRHTQWQPHQDVERADQVWQTDLMIITFRGRDYYLLSYLDVYSRFTVYHRLCMMMTGETIKQATHDAVVLTGIIPDMIQSDNASCYISTEYRSLMKSFAIDHRLIHPHCPQENAEIERYHRTVRELVDVHDASTYAELEELVKERIYYYNYIRYHSKIGFIPPYEKYRGNPERLFEERRKKVERAQRKRMQINAQRNLKINRTRAILINQD
ncbi:transposase [candidate division KSB1 bacterium]|nr:transposase [candidate division KSB1 bacterium]